MGRGRGAAGWDNPAGTTARVNPVRRTSRCLTGKSILEGGAQGLHLASNVTGHARRGISRPAAVSNFAQGAIVRVMNSPSSYGRFRQRLEGSGSSC